MANVLGVLGEKRDRWFLFAVLLPQRAQFSCLVPVVVYLQYLLRVNNEQVIKPNQI